MRDSGQMIVLSAMVACLCLIGVAACVTAIDALPGSMESAYLSHNAINNILWAEGSGLKHEASICSIYAWPQRGEEVSRFKQRSLSTADDLSSLLLKHGVAYRLSYNDSLATQYLAVDPKSDMENIGGVLVENTEGIARIYGCAYDVWISDGISRYSVSRVETF